MKPPRGATGKGSAPPGPHLAPVGRVESPLTDPAAAPKQGDEGAPDAWLVFDAGVLDALDGIATGDRVIVLTWLDRARRDVLRVHPRDDPTQPLRGVFGTRSAERPNPIGLHEVEVVSIEGERVRVRPLEALDGTPVLDVKPVLPPAPGRSSRFRDPFPILQVEDLPRSLRFYRDLLEFEPTYAFPSEDEPQFVALAIPGGQLGLSAGEAAPRTGSVAIWLYTDDVDAAVSRLREAGAPILAEPADQPWGERVASVSDPDAYTVHIGSPEG
jgi:tRNA-Thr(GGU) m(6)t(6)A37 methyltransferase TsaA